MKKELYKLIPFGIASILVLTHIIQTLLKPSYVDADGDEVTYIILDSVKYAGFGLLIVLILMLAKKPIWKYLFAILTFLAITPWISFYHNTFSFGIEIIQLEVTALGILIFHLIVNREVFESFIKLEEEDQESKQAKFEASVNGFQTRFSKKSVDELKNIIDKNSLVPEAVEAAKRLLERK